MKLNEKEYRALVMAAAKKVCDNPDIHFDTPQGAKEALVHELDLVIMEMEDSEDPEAIYTEYIGSTLSGKSMTESMNLLSAYGFDSGLPDIPFFDDKESMDCLFNTFREGAEELGIPTKNGAISAKGEDAKKLLTYVAENFHPDSK